MNTVDKARKAEERRKAALAEFFDQLNTMSSEEIRERLDKKRIRSEERRALAEQLLRDREGEAWRVTPEWQTDTPAARSDEAERADVPREEASVGAQPPPPASADASKESSRSEAAGILGRIGGLLRVSAGLAALALAIFTLRR